MRGSMGLYLRALAGGEINERLPETPHELALDRAKVDELLDRARRGEALNLLDELLNCVDWRAAFVDDEGRPITLEDIARLIAYYRTKFGDVGPLFLAELLSSEFMTGQRARGDVVFSERLLRLGREEPALWQEIRQFFRRKEFATALLAAADAKRGAGGPLALADEDEGAG